MRGDGWWWHDFHGQLSGHCMHARRTCVRPKYTKLWRTLAEHRACAFLFVFVWQAEDAAKMKGYEGEIEAIKKAMATFQE